MINFVINYSSLYLILIGLLAFGYSYLLYKHKTNWSKQVNYILAICRFFLVAMIGLLFMLPSSKYITHYKEKPILTFAVDNSKSLSLAIDKVQDEWKNQMLTLTSELEKSGYNIQLETFNDSVNAWTDINFNHPYTDLNFLITKAQNTYQNQNLAGIFLISDGIYNQGLMPTHNNFKIPVCALALGDTTSKVDLLIKTIYTNKIAYLNNEFPIVVEVVNKGIFNTKTELKLLKGDEIIKRQVVNFNKDYQVQKIRFLAKASEKDIQHYKVILTPLSEERIRANNTKDIFIEILDNKEQILLLALTPHPDLRALQKAITDKSNYDLDVHILNHNKDFKINKKYDLAILHQVPNIFRKGGDFIKILKDKNIPIWYIWGTQTALDVYTQNEKNIKITNLKAYSERVFPVYNKDFDKFQLTTKEQSFFDKCPPISTFFTNYQIPFGTDVILYQKVGNLTLKKPLLIINKTDQYKTATLMGEGLWQWWLHSSLIESKDNPLQHLIDNILQYLSVKDDKRQFKVYTSNNQYTELESVDFITETYNNIYERIFGKKISLTIINKDTNKKQVYEYINGTSEFKYLISNLPIGVYNFEAEAYLNDKLEKSTGSFSVQPIQLELTNQQANFNLLRKISRNTGGQFFLSHQIEEAKNWFIDNKPSDILHSQKKLNPWAESYWFIILLFLLATLEWVARKYMGQY